MYYSPYSEEALVRMSETLSREALVGRESWCIFDNTAAFAATGDALSTLELVQTTS
jgi:uncharacterized protein YecE (DUF72 family)